MKVLLGQNLYLHPPMCVWRMIGNTASRRLLPYDGIRPVYTPEFVSAQVAPLLDEELVMGILLNGAAKAYPVSVLRFREMVDDELGGIPILVTW